MKKIKHLLFFAFIAISINASAGYITINGQLQSETGVAVPTSTQVIVEMERSTLGTYYDTTYTDNAGNYTSVPIDVPYYTTATAKIHYTNCYNEAKSLQWGYLINGTQNYDYSIDLSPEYCYSLFMDVYLEAIISNVPSTTPVSVTWDNGASSSVVTDVATSGNYYDTLYNISISGPFPPVTVSYENCFGNIVTHSATYNAYSNSVNIYGGYCYDTIYQVGYNLTQYYTQENGQTVVSGPTFVDMIYVDETDYTYEWNFGDGSPIYTGLNFTHNYTGNGPYNLCVGVYDNGIRTETYCDVLEIDATGELSGKTNSGFTIVMGDGSDVSTGPATPNYINELNDMVSFNMFPNPASNNFSIDLNSKIIESATINIYSTTGSLVQSNAIDMVAGNQRINMDIQTLNKGVYIVQLVTKQGIITNKLAVK